MRILSVGSALTIGRIHGLNSCRGIKGFTLIELIVVLIIIGLMMMLVTPRLIGSLTKMNLKTSAQKMCSSLRYARSQAVSEQIVYHAVFDLEKNSLVIKAEKPQDEEDAFSKAFLEPEKTDDSMAGESRGESYVLPDGVIIEKAMTPTDDVDSGIFRIEFYPAGNSSGGTVILADEKKRRFQIGVDFITGIVSLTEPDN